MRIPLLFLAALLPFGEKPKVDHYSPIEKEFKLKWKADIGNTTHRSNIQLTEDQLFIGSNGDYYRDPGIWDRKAGVYVLNRKTGKIINHFAGEALGDMDVTGLLIHNNRLYFGNDNEEFICTDLSGNQIWRIPISGDVESEPVLINIKDRSAVVYGTETGEIRAVDPDNGTTIWSYYIREFKGWKPGDNRFIFKIRVHFQNTYTFLHKPLVYDVNGDGVKDIISFDYREGVIAINGINGKLIWKNKSNFSGYHQGSIGIRNGIPVIQFMDYDSNEKSEILNQSVFIGMNGKTVAKIPLTKKKAVSYGQSLNGLNTNAGEYIVATYDTLHVIKGREVWAIDRTNKVEKDSTSFRWSPGERNHHETLLGNRVFGFKNHPRCVALINQNDWYIDGKGFMEIISLTDRRVIKRLEIPGGSEFPPIIEDIDKDGRLDILISCYDGKLYCYSLGIKA
jgi:outer membrane protein assembly factor BamB